MSFFSYAGIFGYPLLGYTLATGVALWICFRRPNPETRLRLRRWGMVTFFLGLLGTLVGIQQASEAVLNASPEHTVLLLAAGMEVALIPLVWGTVVTVVALTGSAIAGQQWPSVSMKLSEPDRSAEAS